MRPKHYASERMAERRNEILATARLLLAERDGNFTMRELARRSGVALATLYNIFGSQDELTSEAIVNVFRGRLTRWSDVNGPPDPSHVERRLEETVAEIFRQPAFARKMVELYFHPGRLPAVARVLHAEPLGELLRFYAAFEKIDMLATGADIELMAGETLVAQYAIIARWAGGDFPDSELLFRLKHVALALLSANLRAPHAGECRSRIRALSAAND